MPIKNPKPMLPGAVLAEIYMKEMGHSQSELARKIGCSHAKVNEIINGKRVFRQSLPFVWKK